MDQKKDKNVKKEQSNVINIGCGGCESKIDAFTDSIEEEIRNENWKKLWDKYGKFVTYVSLGLILSVGVYNMWQKKDISEREAISYKFTSVQNLIMAGNVDDALSQIKELSVVDKKEYAVLAKFEYAALLKDKKDRQAFEIYKSIADDKKVNVLLRDLAYILYVNTSLDIMEPKDLMIKIKDMIKILSSDEKIAKGPWSILANESLAFCYLKSGENDLAKKSLEKLVKTTGIPNDMADRVRIILKSIE